MLQEDTQNKYFLPTMALQTNDKHGTQVQYLGNMADCD